MPDRDPTSLLTISSLYGRQLKLSDILHLLFSLFHFVALFRLFLLLFKTCIYRYRSPAMRSTKFLI
jgi:hypothetical protein